METFRVPHHLERKDKFRSGCHINLVTEPDFPLVLSPQTSFLFTLNLFYAISEHKSGCTFFCEAVLMSIDRAHWNKLVWRGIYGMTEKSVQKVFSFMKKEICVAITRCLVYHLLGGVAVSTRCLKEINSVSVYGHLRENSNNSLGLLQFWYGEIFHGDSDKVVAHAAQRLWPLQPWSCSRPGWTGPWTDWYRDWFSGWQPCPRQGSWNSMIFEISSNPSRSTIITMYWENWSPNWHEKH